MTNQSPSSKVRIKFIQTLFIVILLVISYSSFVISPAFAQVDISGLKYPGQTIQNNWTISELLTGTNLITFVFFLAGLVFFFNLLSAAWEYLLSTGDPKKITGATQRLLNAFTGIVVVLGSFVIVRIVLSVLGIIGF